MLKASGPVVSISPGSKLPLALASKKTVTVKVPAAGESVNLCDSLWVPSPGTVLVKWSGA